MSEEDKSGKDIRLDIETGAKLNIKIEGISIPINSHYVGMEAGEYILIGIPSPFPTIKPKLFPGNSLIVQYLQDGTIFVFVSKIIDVLTKPVRMVILEYPKKIVNRGLRSRQRVTCRIPTNVYFKGSPKDAVIEDISTAGCRISAVYEPKEKNYIARSNDVFKITCRVPASSRDITMTGIIRSVIKKNLSLSYGIQFQEISQEAKSIIDSYLITLQG